MKTILNILLALTAIFFFTYVTNSQNNQYELYIKHGDEKFEMGDFNGAISYYNKAIEKNANSSEAFYKRGNSKFKLGLYNEAINDLNKAYQIQADEKSIVEQIADWEVRLEQQDPNIHKGLVDNPLWSVVPDEAKLAKLIEAVQASGQNALNSIPGVSPAAGPNDVLGVDVPDFLNKNKNADVTVSSGGSLATYNDPSLTGGVPTNWQAQEKTDILNADIEAYRKEYAAYIAETNKRIEEKNAQMKRSNEVGWGLIPDELPDMYKERAKLYRGTGSTIDPVTGIPVLASEPLPLEPPGKYERPLAPLDDKFMGQSKSWNDRTSISKGTPGGGGQRNQQLIQKYYKDANDNLLMGKYFLAIWNFDSVISLDPNNYLAYFNRAKAKFSSGDIEGACNDWSKAGELGYEESYESIKKYCR